MYNSKLLIAGMLGLGTGYLSKQCKGIRHLKLLDDVVEDINSVIMIKHQKIYVA